MATWNSPLGSYATLRVVATESNVNNTNNTSDVTVAVYVDTTSSTGTYDNYNNTLQVKIDGVQVAFIDPFRYNLGAYGTQYYGSWSRTIIHNSDGSKSVPIYVFAYMQDDPDVTISQTLTLTKIPRLSTFSASNVYAGSENIPISLTKSPIATTHKVTVKFGATVVVNNKDIGANPTSVPMATAEWDIFYNLTKTVTSGKLSITLSTYNGATLIGTTSDEATATYATSDIPTFGAISATESNPKVSAVIGTTSPFLKIISKILLSLSSATGVKASTITDYEIKVQKGTTLLATLGNNSIYIPNDIGTFTIYGRVNDSRGRWSTQKSISITILDYRKPTITKYDILRSDVAGTEVLDGTYSKHLFAGTVASVVIGGTEKNQLTYNIYRNTAPAKMVKADTAVVGLSVNSSIVLGTYATATAYEFKLTVKDKFGEQESALDVLPIAQFAAFLGKKGLAVGGIFNEALAEVLQAYGKSVFYDDIRVYGGRTFVDGYDNTTYPLGIYHYSSGVLIDTGLVSTTTSHMCLLRIYGNSYGNLDPIDTLLQFYWYYNETTGVYSFTNVAQRNLGYDLGQIKVMIINGKIHIWIPPLASASYVTLRLELYTWSGTTIPITAATNSAEPSTGVTYKTGAKIARDDGDIVEKGGDFATGYVKYADRRMEQWKTISIPSITFPTALGAMYYAGYKAVGNFLLAFATYNSTCSLEMECSQPDVFCVHSGMPNSSSAGNIYPFSARNAPASVFKVRIRAWGTW